MHQVETVLKFIRIDGYEVPYISRYQQPKLFG
jgi:hypothetical protein